MHRAGDGGRSASMRRDRESAACACAVAVRHGAADQAPLAASRARVPCSLGGCAVGEWSRVSVAAITCCRRTRREVSPSQPTAELVAVGRHILSTALATRVQVRVVGYARSAWAHSCTGLRLATATSAPGLGPSAPHLHRDWAHLCPPLHRDSANRCHICAGSRNCHFCAGTRRCHICAGTWLARPSSGPNTRTHARSHSNKTHTQISKQMHALTNLRAHGYARTHALAHTYAHTNARAHTHARTHEHMHT